MEKTCIDCADQLVIPDNWNESSRRNRTYICRPCSSDRTRNWSWMKRYGITREDYNEWFHSQNGSCAICNVHQNEFGYSLAVDHDHETGKVRGLLCMGCNTGLGKFGDCIEGLEAAIEYLRNASNA